MIQHNSNTWALDLIVRIDRHAPAFCGEMLRSSQERQHVVAAYLAVKPPSESEMSEVGSFLRSANHRTILFEAYGEVPLGLRGALRRSGPAVHDERFYTLLQQVLSDPSHHEIVPTITRLQSLDLNKLLILRMLPKAICRSSVVEVIDDLGDNATRQAHDVAEAYNLLIELEVDGEALAEAIRRVRTSDEFTNLWQRWSSKAKCLVPHPVPTTDSYRPVVSAAEAKMVARKFRNCMAVRYIADLLRGSDFFAIYRHGNEEAVVHLRREEDIIEFSGMYGPRNARPALALRREAKNFLAKNGIRVRGHEREKSTQWDSLRRMMRGPFDFD